MALHSLLEKLRVDWIAYVKEKGEVILDGLPEITMWDGCSERMRKLLYRDGDLFISDCDGIEYSLSEDAGPMTWLELYDVVFGGKEV